MMAGYAEGVDIGGKLMAPTSPIRPSATILPYTHVNARSVCSVANG